MKVLVAIPYLKSRQELREAIASFRHKDVEILLIDNSNDTGVAKELNDNDHFICNKKNLYVNPAWNQAMSYFLDGEWDVLVIANSDVVILDGWVEILTTKLGEDKTVWSPSIRKTEEDYDGGIGVPGFCMILPKKAVEIVYPIPHQLKIWFGDSYIFRKLVGLGWRVMVLADMKARHHISKTILSLPEALGIIEQDKLAWEGIVGLL